MKLNLGCGARVVHGWTNVDYSPGARLSKVPFFRAVNRRVRLFELDWDDRILIHNFTRPFPWGDGVAEVVYSSHTLEHLSKSDGYGFLKECYRVLMKGGILRIVVPDLAPIVNAYREHTIRADEFLDKLGVLYGTSNRRLKSLLIPLVQFPHKCMYDTPTLISILLEIGFHASSREAYSSAIPDIETIEIKERTVDAVIVEGIK